MSEFDLAVGFDAGVMNSAAEVVYRDLYPKLFTGKQKVEKLGVEFDVSWDVKAAPKFRLAPPTEAMEMLNTHLKLWRPEDEFGVEKEIALQTLENELTGTVFEMLLDDMTMTVSSGGDSGEDKVHVSIVVQANSAEGKLTLVPLKATGTTDKPGDEWILNKLILPEAMKMASSLLSGVNLPALEFSGMKLTAPSVSVQQERVVAFANLLGKNVPAPVEMDWPKNPFFAAMSNDARLAVAQSQTSGFEKNLVDDGRISIGIGNVGYTASARLYGLSVALGDAPDVYNFTAEMRGNVNAGIKVGCTDIGVNYDLYPSSQIRGSIKLSISSGTKVSATTQSVDNFVFILKPSGNPLEWILSAITSPILQAVTAAFSPLIKTALEGISFEVWDIPAIPISIDDVYLQVVPDNLSITPWNGMMAIVGDAKFEGK